MTRSKYNVRTDKAGIAARTVDNIRFDSLKEAKRYEELKLLQKAKQIHELEADKRFLRWELKINDHVICTYVADFAYFDHKWKKVIEDVKGVKTPTYRLKKKLMKAIYGIEIKEV